ncbi:hypothetical protein XA68_18512 [Ophiocordyceps unilateralis]|uniref:Phosphatidylinositol-specific phospholipase C X domain-containing protein n=1 Tax=Ophiocordyceps unilateralis TaxID=268505 RepID=A0A2A9P3B6_OPHUN|nr:hypothetical protein XA68_18512 [Ophiocordyceps unilateralis]
MAKWMLRLLTVAAAVVTNSATPFPPDFGALWQGRGGDTGEDPMAISLINATPYRWQRVYTHQYEADGWEESIDSGGGWPEYIESGQAAQVLVRPVVWSEEDAAAEVRYQLQDTSKPMGLQVEWRAHYTYVLFKDELETMNNGKLTEHALGWSEGTGGVGFMLAGTEGEFVSNDGPLNWMQSMLPYIGNLTLRQLALPRSHNAGMWKVVRPIGLGSAFNTVTQRDNLYHQLGDGGIRVLDIRAARWHDHFRHAHYTNVKVLGFQGAFGAGIEEMIDIINRFNRDVPGELIIFDLHPDVRNADTPMWDQLLPFEMDYLYQLLRKLEHRIVIPDDEDVSYWPLSRFIGNGQSAVLIRVSSSWLSRARDGEGVFPGGAEGFITEKSLQCYDHWSNTDVLDYLMKDQLAELAKRRPDRDSPLFGTSWLLTQKAADILDLNSIISMAAAPWRTLYKEFWDALTDQTYPNWISIDDSHRSSLKAMAMAINFCLAAGRCGSLGGKVRDWPREEPPSVLDSLHGRELESD